MKISFLRTGTLVKRYKRFLADITFATGETVTAHCANTGAMRGLNQPGATVWLSYHNNPKRKLAWSWELIELPTATGGVAMASINTARANALVREALEAGVISELAGGSHIRPEVKVGDARLDFELQVDHCHCFVEVKQVTLLEENGIGYFPDAVSVRGLKHLNTLATLARHGKRAVLLFCVAHTGINEVRPAAHIDPAYAKGLKDAIQSGVEVLAYRCRIDAREKQAEIALASALKVVVE
ncbi:DNA/RNA nuclease SfsA [Carnimonas nigrificans]|uniref:DNA/RNA nuclease SfsA n=1 Tax=Carnimonas nigrificans TaxID=64323 RepID=UPI000472B070|nr:DNA/RNA nuclease SfsA [Carnimonas nigrificans]